MLLLHYESYFTEIFKKLYYQAKHNFGTEELQLCKLMIFGPPGVGKSSLFEVLLGNDPDPKRNSTGPFVRKLVQVKVAITKHTGEPKSLWRLIEIKDEILRLHSAIKQKRFKSIQVETKKHMDIVDSGKPAIKEENVYTYKGFFDSDKLAMKAEKHTTDTSKDIVISDKDTLQVEKILFDTSPIETNVDSSIMACYDSGGQPEFFDVMPALTTIPTRNIMVFDLSKDLFKKVDSEFYADGKSGQLKHKAHYTTAELMKTAIANIQSCYEKVSTTTFESNSGCLLVVGTHLDKCGETDDEKLQKIDEIETAMFDDVLTGEAGQMVHYDCKGRIIHAISNTCDDGRDEAAQKIRTAIEDMSRYEKLYSQVPLNWLLFQLEIQLRNKNYILRGKCIEIAKKCFIEENEVDSVLNFFHEFGIILHYKEVSALKDIVFCDPQWLFDHLIELVKLKYNTPPAMQKFIKKGIFNKIQLRNIKKEDIDGELQPESLLELFTYLKIMSKLPNKHDQYFMPALLNPVSEDLSLQKEYGAKVNDTLLVKFENRCFPRGMFCCLVTDLMQSNWEIQFNHVYKDVIIFKHMPSPLYVILCDKIYHMTVEIHHKGQKKNLNETNHYKVCNKLYESLMKLCKMFKMNSDFKFGFSCQCCESFAGILLQYAISTKYSCSECESEVELNDDQLVWFLPSSVYMQVLVGVSYSYIHTYLHLLLLIKSV